MSQGGAIAYSRAMTVALGIVGGLQSSCHRIEIAGSLRRGKRQVHDIEIVAVPRWENRPTGDIWDTQHRVDVTEEAIDELLVAGVLSPRDVENHRADGTIEIQHKLGRAFKALVADGVPLDLFIVREPATWGVIFGLRTGPGDWNTRLVTDCKAIGRRVEGGQVVAWTSSSSSWEPVPTPEERDFFRAIGQPWVDPAERNVGRVAISRAVADAVLA